MKKGLLILLVLAGIAAAVGWKMYTAIFVGDATKFETDSAILYVPSGANFDTLKDSLSALLLDIAQFEKTADLKDFGNTVKPGRYRIKKGTSYNDLVNQLRIGAQEPVQVTFNNARTLDEFAGKVSRYFESDSTAIATYLRLTDVAQNFGFDKATFPSMFLPDTYQMYWTDKPEKIVDRMAKAFKSFWTEERIQKARKMNLSQSEVTTLASIVQAETAKRDEAKRVAGVYVNRIKRGIPLQADPTLKFAIGDFGLRRILNKHKEVDSPYNTYKYKGLPPGPINLPSKNYVDAVLNSEKHDYIYFCAKADFSGYHAFAKTLSQHNSNARAYQRELNKRGIYR